MTTYKFHKSKEDLTKALERMQLRRLNFDLLSIVTGPMSVNMRKEALESISRFMDAMKKL